MIPYFFGASHRMKDLESRVHRVALFNLPVLIEGESGTGKEMLAQYIHSLSRPKTPFIRYYCGAGEERLRPLHLFPGHPAHPGAEAGTVFLKHINVLPAEFQHELLGAILTDLRPDPGDNGQIPRLRLISAAVEPLEPLVARGAFLPDLYFRLAVCRLSLPPLRERTMDLEDLFWMMVRHASGDGNGAVPAPKAQVLEAFKNYQWPGNLQELQNFARSYAVSQDSEQMLAEIDRRLTGLTVAPPPRGNSLKDQVRRASRELEAEIILKALEQHRWNRRRAAESLRISYRALLYKMKDCNLRADLKGEAI